MIARTTTLLLLFSQACGATGQTKWFPLVQQSFSENSSFPLRKCTKKLNVAPPTGSQCGKTSKTCFFGDQQCDRGAYPSERCTCDGNPNQFGTWTCEDVSCSDTFLRPEDTPTTIRPKEGNASQVPRCDGVGREEIHDGDLGIRFNKISFSESQIVPSDVGTKLPLGAQDYPLCPAVADMLRKSQSISVVAGFDCKECDIPLDDLVQAAGGWPSHPSSNNNTDYWNDLLEVVQAQERRLSDEDPTKLLKLPKIWTNYTIHDVAKAVHDEYPGSHHVNLILQLLGEGARMDRSILPSLSTADFIRGVVALADLNTWAIGTVSPHNFQLKWAGGRARPEEVAFWIFQTPEEDLVSDQYNVPLELIRLIKAMTNITNAPSFTAYPEGSPKHPSWPAMHSAASVSCLWLSTVMNLTAAQQCEVMAVDYAVAYARTVAGVHYPTDNIAGLNLGTEVLTRKLPTHLEERYGSDPSAVRAKIASMSIDWNNYLTGPCFSNR